jgi:hypothetical protein
VRGLPTGFALSVEPQLREASVSCERTFVGLDVHAWSVTVMPLTEIPQSCSAKFLASLAFSGHFDLWYFRLLFGWRDSR